MSREPLVIINALITLFETVITLAVAFSIDTLSPEQVAAISAVIIALAELVKTVWSRSEVTPVRDPMARDGRRLNGQVRV